MTDKPVIELSRRDAMKLGATAVGVATVGVGVGPRQVAAQTVSDFISGTVVDGDGNPVENVWVLADPHNDNGSPIDTLGVLATQTDVNGDYEFSFSELYDGTNFYQVYCRFGSSTDPQRAQENYPWVEAEGFSPNSIASLAHWYDATEITGLNDGESVSTWPDEEGTDGLTQATGSKQPTYQTNDIGGHPIVRFDGTDDFMAASITTLTQPNTIFLAFQLSATGSQEMFDAGTGADHLVRDENDGPFWNIFAGGEVDGGSSDTDPHIFTALFNGASSTVRIDGSEEGSGDVGTGDLDGISVGARGGEINHANVDIGEILVYDADLSDADRDSVETYLSDKWGITIA